MRVSGAVLGIDVGYSARVASSAVCRFDWDARTVAWTVQRFRATPDDRQRVLADVGGGGCLEAAAFDGPLRSDLEVIGTYRVAERMLTRRLWRKIGKPGQSSAPVGKRLNEATNDCARVVIAACDLASSRHAKRIHAQAVVEAFPSSFMGVMLDDPAGVPNRRRGRTDVFYAHLAATGGFARLLEHLLPGRTVTQDWAAVRNHDERMALVCALTALAVAADDYGAVGDPVQGWIILPPQSFVQDWALADLQENAIAETQGTLFFPEGRSRTASVLVGSGAKPQPS